MTAGLPHQHPDQPQGDDAQRPGRPVDRGGRATRRVHRDLGGQYEGAHQHRRSGHPQRLAGLVSATVFGLAHVWPPLVLFAFVVGVVHAWMRERSGSIWPAVISHAVVNTLSIVMIALIA